MAKTLLPGSLALLWCLNVYGAEQQQNVHDHAVCAPDGVAVGGYDLVSYFQPSGPTQGSPTITVILDDLTYRFQSDANKQQFLQSPDRYLPHYLGWCSMNLAMGRLACPDFSNFQIEDGQLLLFEHAGFTNGKDVWNSDPGTHRRSADQHFQRLAN